MLSSFAFTGPGTLPLATRRADHLVLGGTMAHLCPGGERGKRVRWEQGGEMQDLCREEQRVFPAVRPLCASCQAVMLSYPTGGALEVEGLGQGRRVGSLQSLLAQSHSDEFALHAL